MEYVAISDLFNSNCKEYFNDVRSIKNFLARKRMKPIMKKMEMKNNQNQLTKQIDGDSLETTVCILKLLV